MNSNFEAIGKYIFYFSHLEQVVRVVAKELLGLSDDQYHGVMPVIDFAGACNVCKAEISKEKLPLPQVGPALDLINRALKCNEDRIRVAHGSWRLGLGAAVASHVSRTTLRETHYFSNPGELDEKAEALKVLAGNLWDFFLSPEHGLI